MTNHYFAKFRKILKFRNYRYMSGGPVSDQQMSAYYPWES